MAYERQENLGGLTPIWASLTFVHLVGAGCGAFVVWLIAGLVGFHPAELSAAWFLGGALYVIGGVVGLVVVYDFAGISIANRLWLAIQYWVRKPMGGNRIEPTLYTPPNRHAHTGFTIQRAGQTLLRPHNTSQGDHE